MQQLIVLLYAGVAQHESSKAARRNQLEGANVITICREHTGKCESTVHTQFVLEFMWFVALYALNQAWILAGCREGQTLSQLHMTRRAPRVGTPAAKLKEPEPEAQEQTAEKDLPAVPDTTAAEYRRMLGKHMRTLPSLAVSSVNPEQRGRRNLHMNLLKRQACLNFEHAAYLADLKQTPA